MRFLLDTNAIIDLERGDENLRRQIFLYPKTSIVTSSIVVTEFTIGFYLKHRQSKSARIALTRVFQQFCPLPYDHEDAQEAANLIVQNGLVRRQDLYRDMMIAAQAKRRGLVVVTNNTRDFYLAIGVGVANWKVAL
jgi:tRNA(fMet)-specific endonuclease VapC